MSNHPATPTTDSAFDAASTAAVQDCPCRQCVRARDAQENGGVDAGLGFRIPTELTRMILCPTCGNKRCPHANDHRLACTGSNEPGQVGSAYP